MGKNRNKGPGKKELQKKLQEKIVTAANINASASNEAVVKNSSQPFARLKQIDKILPKSNSEEEIDVDSNSQKEGKASNAPEIKLANQQTDAIKAKLQQSVPVTAPNLPSSVKCEINKADQSTADQKKLNKKNNGKVPPANPPQRSKPQDALSELFKAEEIIQLTDSTKQFLQFAQERVKSGNPGFMFSPNVLRDMMDNDPKKVKEMVLHMDNLLKQQNVDVSDLSNLHDEFMLHLSSANDEGGKASNDSTPQGKEKTGGSEKHKRTSVLHSYQPSTPLPPAVAEYFKSYGYPPGQMPYYPYYTPQFGTPDQSQPLYYRFPYFMPSQTETQKEGGTKIPPPPSTSPYFQYPYFQPSKVSSQPPPAPQPTATTPNYYPYPYYLPPPYFPVNSDFGINGDKSKDFQFQFTSSWTPPTEKPALESTSEPGVKPKEEQPAKLEQKPKKEQPAKAEQKIKEEKPPRAEKKEQSPEAEPNSTQKTENTKIDLTKIAVAAKNSLDRGFKTANKQLQERRKIFLEKKKSYIASGILKPPATPTVVSETSESEDGLMPGSIINGINMTNRMTEMILGQENKTKDLKATKPEANGNENKPTTSQTSQKPPGGKFEDFVYQSAKNKLLNGVEYAQKLIIACNAIHYNEKDAKFALGSLIQSRAASYPYESLGPVSKIPQLKKPTFSLHLTESLFPDNDGKGYDLFFNVLCDHNCFMMDITPKTGSKRRGMDPSVIMLPCRIMHTVNTIEGKHVISRYLQENAMCGMEKSKAISDEFTTVPIGELFTLGNGLVVLGGSKYRRIEGTLGIAIQVEGMIQIGTRALPTQKAPSPPPVIHPPSYNPLTLTLRPLTKLTPMKFAPVIINVMPTSSKTPFPLTIIEKDVLVGKYLVLHKDCVIDSELIIRGPFTFKGNFFSKFDLIHADGTFARLVEFSPNYPPIFPTKIPSGKPPLPNRPQPNDLHYIYIEQCVERSCAPSPEYKKSYPEYECFGFHCVNPPAFTTQSLMMPKCLMNKDLRDAVESQEKWPVAKCGYCGKLTRKDQMVNCEKCVYARYCSSACQSAPQAQKEHGRICADPSIASTEPQIVPTNEELQKWRLGLEAKIDEKPKQ
ncbi:hypothetical protein HK098_000165 [Nowakowskiella sp. JEL0407]|nr:hypothetical protein HK098_000165 [Nowakowskiella sp. JEL0407]